MKIKQQSTIYEVYPIVSVFNMVKPLFAIIVCIYVISLVICDSLQILAMKAHSWLVVLWWTFIFLSTYCSISWYDKP